ncbi:endonuclease/exonuclease/phosphatase family protein [Kribbella catacumbae]|uniref:endonuclease/exonuclease/phosphatase family protein n=1 Tax=Kribbella catacumbae TaxID=460086 RepID=UPI000376FB27|nr:endonuclease/exonuclease/phosphatase family protein [Kribbella catacumbae]
MSYSRRDLLRTSAGVATVAAGAGLLSAEPAVATTEQFPKSSGSVRVMTWNIYKGGHGIGEGNLPHLLDQLVRLRPDIYLAVETYGSGEAIRRALSRGAGHGSYSAVQITDRPPGRDNLWIFTHLPIVHVYPKPTGGQTITDFNLGGIRVRLAAGEQLNAFVTWINYTDPWVGYLMDENAAGIRAGLEPRHRVDEVIKADQRQTVQLQEIVDQHLPAMLAGNTDPVVIGGDLNTVPADDWSTAWAGSANHFGISYPFTGTKVLTDAGFTDTFRQAHPDAAAEEGRTWSPLPTERLITPQRIDMIFTKGPLRVERAAIVDQRLRHHGPGTFYSDHAAVTTDLRVEPQP